MNYMSVALVLLFVALVMGVVFFSVQPKPRTWGDDLKDANRLGKPAIDLPALDAAFEQLASTAKPAHARFLIDIVFRRLAGHEESDEFVSPTEAAQRKASLLAETKSAVLLLELPVTLTLGAYDHERRTIAANVTLPNKVTSDEHQPWLRYVPTQLLEHATNMYFSAVEYTATFSFSDAGAAKAWKTSFPRLEAEAKVVLRPLSVNRSNVTPSIVVWNLSLELLGLRFCDADSHTPVTHLRPNGSEA